MRLAALLLLLAAPATAQVSAGTIAMQLDANRCVVRAAVRYALTTKETPADVATAAVQACGRQIDAALERGFREGIAPNMTFEAYRGNAYAGFARAAIGAIVDARSKGF